VKGVEGVKTHDVTLIVVLALAGVPSAQIGQITGRAGQAKDALQKARNAIQELRFSEAEERQLGADVSAKLRERYGVVQDEAVHRYVSLVGTVVAGNSSRADLPWTFIVLDTDAVNAFAAPGGFVHITRGALALIRNEAELAGVVAHEVGHIMARHTIKAIQKTKVEGALARAATRSAFLQQMGSRLYETTLENSFDRGDEMEADKVSPPLANDAGYHPGGLAAFLTRLADRNRALTERSGVFASHPETKARIDELDRMPRRFGLKNTPLVQARYAAAIAYTPVDISQLSRPAGGRYGVAGMSALGAEKSSSSTIASAGSRGVNPDRDARGGPNKGLVVVTLSPEEIAEFRKGIIG
jgi:predicted Zn-dependent protease